MRSGSEGLSSVVVTRRYVLRQAFSQAGRSEGREDRTLRLRDDKDGDGGCARLTRPLG